MPNLAENLEQAYEKATRRANQFYEKVNYKDDVDSINLDRTFELALKEFLNKSGVVKQDLWNLGVVAEGFEDNPALHHSKYNQEIYIAIDLLYHLFRDDQRQVAKSKRQLSEIGTNLP